MRDVRIIMGMPITVEIVETQSQPILNAVYDYFSKVDARFSTYKDHSEISAFNRGEIAESDFSVDMQEVFQLARQTEIESDGFFAIKGPDGFIDPSGIVKGWAIRNASQLVRDAGFKNFYIDAGGDVQTAGVNCDGKAWRVGIRSPFNDQDVIKAVQLKGQGIATSGTYVRGQHIYNPHDPQKPITDIVSLSVIGPDVLEADRFATAAFAMGEDGIYFIESLQGFEGYQVNASGIATQTTGFGAYVIS
jgi:FAD:protein FMN transferase